MSYPLHVFAPEFFFPSTQEAVSCDSSCPTTLLEAIEQLALKEPGDWEYLAGELGVACEFLTPELVLEHAMRLDSCRSLTTPVEVYLDERGWCSVLVH